VQFDSFVLGAEGEFGYNGRSDFASYAKTLKWLPRTPLRPIQQFGRFARGKDPCRISSLKDI
jgi:hypothetical protein